MTLIKSDPFSLARFVEAQGESFSRAKDEIIVGHKSGHWMWFIFPQIAGLGSSEMSRRYAITSLDEARAYLKHSTLGPRLIELSSILASHSSTAENIFGSVDSLKLRSSMTLFAQASTDPSVFLSVIDHLFEGEIDSSTIEILHKH